MEVKERTANSLLDELMQENSNNNDSSLNKLDELQKNEINSMKKTATSTAVETLSSDELEKAKTLASQLKFNSPDSVLSYGALTQSRITSFSQNVLDKVQAQDVGQLGSSLTELMYSLENAKPNELMNNQKTGFFQKFIKQAKYSIFQATQKYQQVGASVDKIATKLDNEKQGLLDDNKMLEELYDENLNYFKALNVFIAGAELKMNELDTKVLPEARKAAEATDDNMLLIQNVNDLETFRSRLDKRTHDLRLARQMTIQQAPQIRLIQNTNQGLAEKIQTSVNTAIPLWKNQVAIALTLLKQKDALVSQRIVSETTNDLLRKNSEMLKQSTIEAAKEGERGFIDIETLEATQQNLVDTISETIRIQSEGRKAREEGRIVLAKIEEEMKAKLLEISNHNDYIGN